MANSRGRALTRHRHALGGPHDARRSRACPWLVRAHGGVLWTVAEPAPPALGPAKKGPQIRVALRDGGIELDPAFGPYPAASQLLYSTCAKLVNYPDAAGAAGARLLPDAAAALPVDLSRSAGRTPSGSARGSASRRRRRSRSAR